MERQYRHAQLAKASHDEQAMQDFIQSFKLHLARKVVAGNRTVYEEEARPAFEHTHGRAPRDRHDVRDAMAEQPYYRMWSALQRVSQDMNWNAVADNVTRQLPALIETSKSWTEPVGSLTLNPEIDVPRYLSAVDIHCVPGNYHSESTEDDLAQGAIFDRGGYVYS
ncbi:MAG: class I SAM-dependent methyltransferase, partial [Proteobacteria bacterium]|nr:class I SAM-dependent methyltransferase [Pseudomonadota bacterium]